MADKKDDFDFRSLDDDFNSKGNGRDDDDIHIEVLDATDTPPSIADSESGIEKLEGQLVELRKEKEEIYDRLLRKHAEFENFRKRTEKDKRQFQQYVLADFIGELVVILDNFERALSHSDEQSGQEYRKGVELIYRQFKDLLEKKGIRAIETEGRAFDPNFHEAMSRELRNDLPENTILQELQKGYLFHDKLLRPALVKVSFQSEETQPEGQNPEEAQDQGKSEDGWENNE